MLEFGWIGSCLCYWEGFWGWRGRGLGLFFWLVVRVFGILGLWVRVWSGVGIGFE